MRDEKQGQVFFFHMPVYECRYSVVSRGEQIKHFGMYNPRGIVNPAFDNHKYNMYK